MADLAPRAKHAYRDDPDVPAFEDGGPIAVMDGECALCSWVDLGPAERAAHRCPGPHLQFVGRAFGQCVGPGGGGGESGGIEKGLDSTAHC